MYESALFLHLFGAVLFFSGAAVAAVAHARALRSKRPSEIAAVLGLARLGVVLVAAGTLFVLAFGLWLVDLVGYGYGDAWISAALALLVVAGGLGALGGRKPKEARQLAARLARDGDEPSPELARLLRHPVSLVLNYASGLAALVILALMVWKPGA